MAKIEISNGIIRSLSGKLGQMYYRTLKSGKIIAATAPSPRTSPLSPVEVAARRRFAWIASEVARMIKQGDTRDRKTIWHEVASGANAGQSQVNPRAIRTNIS